MSSRTNLTPGDQGSERGRKLPQYIAALSVCMGSLAAGAVLGWTGNISEAMKVSTYNGIEIDDESLGWIGSCATLGAATACLFIGKLCDILGRKPAMLLLTAPFIAGWLMIIFASSLTTLYIGRVLTGMAGGAFCVSAPIYTSEIAEKEIRGALGSYFELLLTIGISIAYAIAMVTDMKTYTIIMTTLPGLFAIGFAFQPETPVFLMKKNNEKGAKAALIRLRGKSYDVDSELQDIKNNLLDEQKNQISLGASLRKKATRKAALVCFSLMFFQQAGGINAVVFYTDGIFKSSGSKLDPQLCTLVTGLMQTAATFVSSLIVDRLGRRVLLMSSLFFMTLSGGLLGVFFTLQERGVVDPATIASLGFVPITSLSVFVIVFSLGIGPIPWMLSAELFPPEIRSSATGVAATLNWCVAFLVTKFYLDLRNAVGGDVTFYGFSAVSLVGSLFVYFVVPETKMKTLEEIQEELNGGVGVGGKLCRHKRKVYSLRNTLVY